VRTLNRIATLAMVLIGVALIPFVGSLLGGRSAPEGAAIPRSEEGEAYILIGGKPYRTTDRDGDQRIDCLVPIGPTHFFRTAFAAEGQASECKFLGWFARPMDPTLQSLLGQMARLKLALDLGYASCIDLDWDRKVDCVVSVHNPRIVVLGAPGAACATAPRETLDEPRRERLNELLGVEEAIREQVNTAAPARGE
jgi:hypothetical protein